MLFLFFATEITKNCRNRTEHIVAERRRVEDSWSEARREPEDKGIKARNPADSRQLSGSRRDRPPAPGPKRLGENEGKTPTTHHETRRPSGEPKARRKEGRNSEPKVEILGEPRRKRRRETALATDRRVPSKRNPSPPAAEVIIHREERSSSPSTSPSPSRESGDESSRSTCTSRSPSPTSESE